MAVLLLSVHPLLHLHLLTGLTFLLLAPGPAGDCSYQRGGEGRAPLLVSLVTNDLTSISPITGNLPFPAGSED